MYSNFEDQLNELKAEVEILRCQVMDHQWLFEQWERLYPAWPSSEHDDESSNDNNSDEG